MAPYMDIYRVVCPHCGLDRRFLVAATADSDYAIKVARYIHDWVDEERRGRACPIVGPASDIVVSLIRKQEEL